MPACFNLFYNITHREALTNTRVLTQKTNNLKHSLAQQ